MTVPAHVDTGSYMLCNNENIQKQLQLSFLEKRKGQMADGSIPECYVAGPIKLRFKNRRTMCNAIVLPGDNEILSVPISIKDMDVLIIHNVKN